MKRLFYLAILSVFLALPNADARHRQPVRGAVVGVGAKAKAGVGRLAHAGKALLHRARHPFAGRCR